MAFVMGCTRLLVTFSIVIFGIYASQVTCRKMQEYQQLSMSEKHELWMARHGRSYENDFEKEKRLGIFKENVKFIESFNNDNGTRSYKLGINKFADLTNEEFLSYYTGLKVSSYNPPSSSASSSPTSSFVHENLTDIPETMDWRKSGGVTEVKNQKHCGCCWAFSAVGALEGANKLSTGNLISLSEQQLLDCTTENNGCNGGLMTAAYDFIIQNGGISTESNYPYEGNQDTCKSQDMMKSAVKITRYETLPSSESALLKAVSQQPVSIGITVNEEFKMYQTGVYDGSCDDQVNHAVTVVGYGTNDDGTKYWLIKNSWGSSWGENGYMKIARDTGIEGGICGITTYASYPVLIIIGTLVL